MQKKKNPHPTQDEQNTNVSNKDRITITDFSSWPRASLWLSTVQGGHRSLVILSRAARLLDTRAHTPLQVPACVTPGKLLNLSEIVAPVVSCQGFEGNEMCEVADFL